MSSLGLFQQPSYITIGNEYEPPKDTKSDRFKGKGMYTGPGGGTFSGEIRSLHEGDKYVDPGLRERKAEKERNANARRGNDVFKFSSPGKKSTGPGNYYGTFAEKPYTHETEYNVLKKGEIMERSTKPVPKNFLTTPGRKGTYGYPGTTLGDGSRYISNPFRDNHPGVDARDSNKGCVGPPFKASCKPSSCFDSSNSGVSKVYSIDRPLPCKRLPSLIEKRPLQPWKPGNPPKKGYNCTLTSFPQYKEDPYEMRRREPAKQLPSVVWKPISGVKSTPTRTVYTGP